MQWDEKTQAWALTLTIGVVGWLVKDFFFGVLAKRDEVIRSEWKEMLKSLWSPLYYWSGIVHYNDGKAGWSGHGVGNLESLLSANAHLIPHAHYRTLVRVLENASGLEKEPPSVEDVKATRAFILGRIEALNYLLYRRSPGYDPATAMDVLAAPRLLLRGLSVFALHTLVWAVIVGVFASVYVAYTREYVWPAVLALALVFGAVAVDWLRRFRLKRELQTRLGPSKRRA